MPESVENFVWKSRTDPKFVKNRWVTEQEIKSPDDFVTQEAAQSIFAVAVLVSAD